MAFWMVFGLWVVYVALTANWEVGNLVLGLLIAVGLTLLLRPEPRTIDPRRLPTAFLALMRYLIVVIYDMFASGLRVARILLDPALPIKPGIIAIPTGCASELATALSAHSITLAPGEMVIEIDEPGVMYVHALDATRAEEYVAGAQQLRQDLLRRIFP
jgi:multicomponent Na+:H+ antiporter subunit E